MFGTVNIKVMGLRMGQPATDTQPATLVLDVQVTQTGLAVGVTPAMGGMFPLVVLDTPESRASFGKSYSADTWTEVSA